MNGQYFTHSQVYKKAQVLIISVWILSVLAFLAVVTGRRVSLALRLSRYQTDRLKAIYLAKAGINRAIAEIKKDDISCDSLKDKWADNKGDFEIITLGENQDGFATVSYTAKEDGREEAVFGVVDEERKININTAPRELLIELLDTAGVSNSAEIADNICAYRGDIGVPLPGYQDLGYLNKANKFCNIEELTQVLGVTADIYGSFKELITVYPADGAGRVNVNTASKKVLEILINTSFKKLQEGSIPVENPAGLLEGIMDFRNKENGVFTDTNLESNLDGLSNSQKNILNDPTDGLKNKICVQSDYFRIASSGNIRASKLKRKIDCVFSRSNSKITYWHEN